MGNETPNHQILHKKISLITIAKQACAWHFWVFLSTNFLFRWLAKEGRKIGESERKMFEDYSTPHGKRYFVNLSWVIPCCEQKLGIGAQAMCIACNDTSVIVINFRKSKTHAITDTYCIKKIKLISSSNVFSWRRKKESKTKRKRQRKRRYLCRFRSGLRLFLSNLTSKF